MGLNPNLIHLMTVRNQAQTEARTPVSVPEAPSGRSFQEVLEESIQQGGAVRPTEGSASVVETSRPTPLSEPSSEGRSTRLSPAQMMSPDRILQRFVQEHDLVLAVQRTPQGRPRQGAEEDPNGERVTRSNLHPVD